MARIFVSYAREDGRAVGALVAELVDAGHEVWWDRSLAGGQEWWSTILAQIRSCRVFLIVVSPASVTSTACGAETRYADALGRPILPVVVKPVAPQVLLPVVAARQLVDRRRSGPRARRELDRAVGVCLAEPRLPSGRLPPPPPAPGADLNELAALVHGSAPLPVDSQEQVLLRLRSWLGRPDYRDTARGLLADLRRRPELTQHVAGEIASTLAWLDGGYERGPRHLGWLYTGVIFTAGLLGIVLGALHLRHPAWRPHAHVLLVLGVAWGIYIVASQLMKAS